MSVISFLGAGNIAQAIIGGLIENGTNPSDIVISDPFPATRDKAAEMGVTIAADNQAACQAGDVVMICVKPDVVLDVLKELSNIQDKLFVSVAAGITTESMGAALTPTTALVRCMPNTPALVRTGMTALYPTSAVTEQHRHDAEKILRAVGQVVWVEKESDLDAITAVSGSGPAYYFLMMEAMVNAAEAMGLNPDTARTLVLQTALGAATMASQSEDPPAQLRQNVTSKGGTTQAALEHFEANEFRRIVDGALTAARDRSIEMSKS